MSWVRFSTARQFSRLIRECCNLGRSSVRLPADPRPVVGVITLAWIIVEYAIFLGILKVLPGFELRPLGHGRHTT